jgi:hypothetical protein
MSRSGCFSPRPGNIEPLVRHVFSEIAPNLSAIRAFSVAE